MSDADPLSREPVSHAQAIDIARRFLTGFWNDIAAPNPVPAKDAFGVPVWRINALQQNRSDGLHGMLTVDIDASSGEVAGVKFNPFKG